MRTKYKIQKEIKKLEKRLNSMVVETDNDANQYHAYEYYIRGLKWVLRND